MRKSRTYSKAYRETFVILVTTLAGFLIFFTISQLSHKGVKEKALFSQNQETEDVTENLVDAAFQGHQFIQAIDGGMSGQSQQLIQSMGEGMVGDSYFKSVSSQDKTKINQAIGVYTRKYQNASASQKKQMTKRAQSFMTKYKRSSDDQKRRMVEDAQRKAKQMNL